MTDFSIIVPVYNSEQTLQELFSRVQQLFIKLQKTCQFVFVDDGSEDNSWEVLKMLKSETKDPVTIIRLNKNYGQHNAVFCGLAYAEGANIVTLDDDLQHPPEEIAKLIESQNKHDDELTYGISHKTNHPLYRKLGSRIVRTSSDRFLNRPSMVSSFRLIKKTLADKILQHERNFIFIDELLFWYTNKVSYTQVRHDKRKVNRSGYSYGKLWRFFTNLLIYYTNFPLKLMVYGGLLGSIFFFLVSVYYILAKLFYDVPLGYTSIIVGIMLSTSLILFSLGIIGEYLSRLYLVHNQKPPFIIQSVEK